MFLKFGSVGHVVLWGIIFTLAFGTDQSSTSTKSGAMR